MGNDIKDGNGNRTDLIKILLYVILTFTVTWTIWFFAPAVQLLGSCMPSIVGFILLLIWKETAGVGKRMTDFRSIRVSWYPVIFLTIPTVTLLAYFTYSLVSGETPPLGFYGYLKNPASLLLIAFLSLGAGIGEELGWRGLLQDTFQKRLSPLLSSVLVGVIWASWHIPFPVMMGESLFSPHFINYFVFVLLVAVLIGRIYTGNGRSILATILFHGMVNITAYSFFPKNDIPIMMDILRTGYLAITIAGVTLVFRKKKAAVPVNTSENISG